MKKVTLVRNPVNVNELRFDDLYDEISGDWQLKAERLIQRRQKRLRMQGV